MIVKKKRQKDIDLFMFYDEKMKIIWWRKDEDDENVGVRIKPRKG